MYSEAYRKLCEFRSFLKEAHERFGSNAGPLYTIAFVETENAVDSLVIAGNIPLSGIIAGEERARLIAHYAARIDRDAQTLAQLRGE